jgi:nicotinamide riboside transporter PnuC|tara:strand:- start:56 stop:298 length:243 start_codon:yes stop_codon:yes gene_type:complete
MERKRLMKKEKILEWLGVITAIIYSLLVAMNIGAEFLGFTLLLISAVLIGLWAFIGKHNGILLLQLFYASAGIIGMVRWF